MEMEWALPEMLPVKPNSTSSTGACLPISHRGKLNNLGTQLRPRALRELHCDSILHMCPLAITSVRHYEVRLPIQILDILRAPARWILSFKCFGTIRTQCLHESNEIQPLLLQPWRTPALPSNCNTALWILAYRGYLVALRLPVWEGGYFITSQTNLWCKVCHDP